MSSLPIDQDVRIMADVPEEALGSAYADWSADPSGRVRRLEAGLEALRVTVARLEAELRGIRWQLIDVQDAQRGR